MIYVLLLLVVGAAAYLISLYNKLRGLSEGVKREQSNLVGELRKRATLVNQLIDVCQGYGDHEKLTHLTIASGDSAGSAEQLAAQTSTVLASVGMMANRFPDLKANQTYNTLMGQLEKIENQLQAKRESMNKEVELYNRTRSGFPAVLIAQQLGFPEARYFSTDEAGLDQAQHFRTDDGELLKAQFARLGQGAAAAAKQLGQQANAAVRTVREQAAAASSETAPAEAPTASDAGTCDDAPTVVTIVETPEGEAPEDPAPKA